MYVPVTVAVPAAVPVKATEQLPAALRVQLGAFREPVPVDVKLTLPPGVIAVATSVSVTVAVHVEAWLITTVPGLQTTLVAVERLLTVIVFDAGLVLPR